MNDTRDSELAAREESGGGPGPGMMPVEHWAYQVESPFRPVEELLQLAEAAGSAVSTLGERPRGGFAMGARAEGSEEAVEEAEAEAEEWGEQEAVEEAEAEEWEEQEAVGEAEAEEGAEEEGLEEREAEEWGEQEALEEPEAEEWGEQEALEEPEAEEFTPVAVETPGGQRIRDKRPPAPSDVTSIIGYRGRWIRLHRLAADGLAAMTSEARADGIPAPRLEAASGYRSAERQNQLWQAALVKYGSPEAARRWVAPPQRSAHGSGRAVDLWLGLRIASENASQLRQTAAHRWLVANASRFGFYPYKREPWHWEYNPLATIESEAAAGGGATATMPAPISTARCVETGARASALVERGQELAGRTFARRRGRLGGRIHAAMDLPGPRRSAVYAPLDGEVLFAGKKCGYGNLVVLLHRNPPLTTVAGPGAVTTAFAHLDSVSVARRDCVRAGQTVGTMGNTAESATGRRCGVRRGMGVHLHFSVQRVSGDATAVRDTFTDVRPPPIPDVPVDRIGGRFSSAWEEDWTRRVRPDLWLRQIGVPMTQATPRETSEVGWSRAERASASEDEVSEAAGAAPLMLLEKPASRPDLGVTAKQIGAYDWAFKKAGGTRFKQLVEWAAKEVDMNPGLVAENLLAEARRSTYFAKGVVSTYQVGADDFYEKRHDIAAKVAAYKKIHWDEASKRSHDNDAKKPRRIVTVDFNSGRDALLGSAVSLKHGEVVMRAATAAAGKDFDALPVDVRFALIRLAFNAGHGRARKNLADVLNGREVLIRKSVKDAGPQRRATIHAARAMHLSSSVFGI